MLHWFAGSSEHGNAGAVTTADAARPSEEGASAETGVGVVTRHENKHTHKTQKQNKLASLPACGSRPVG